LIPPDGIFAGSTLGSPRFPRLPHRNEPPDVELAFAFQIDAERAFEIIGVGERVADEFRHANLTLRTLALHSARHIHRVAPDIEDEFRLADNAGRYRTGVD